MIKTENSSKIYTELNNQLQLLTDQIVLIRRLITEIEDKFCEAEQSPVMPPQELLTRVEGAASMMRGFSPRAGGSMKSLTGENNYRQRKSHIIPFTRPGCKISSNAGAEYIPSSEPVIAVSGKPLPYDIFDYRPLLQRDGLILLAWDKRLTEMGDRYTAYWVTSTGIPRFYASKPLSEDQFCMALPHHKSYAAEDGIEFYGQKAPAYIIHVAPELMMSNPLHRELRQDHIETLRKQGVTVDFDHEFLLTARKKLGMPRKKSAIPNTKQAGQKLTQTMS